ncbi:MAG: hypothetical protein SOU13_11995 [Eubacteriales bacterium]|nr:hypothetical protein [Eubacteriales bacterium]
MYEYKRHAARIKWLIVTIVGLFLPKILTYIKFRVFKITQQEVIAAVITYAIVFLIIQVVHNPKRHYPEEDEWEEKEKERKQNE